jgi:chemotaxis protein CheC
MTESQVTETPLLQNLHRLFSAATTEAATAMCRWTGGQITMALDDVLEMPLEGIFQELGVDDELLTMVVLGLRGASGGDMILAFDDINARQLAASLSGRPPHKGEPWTDIEKSALCETGNILGCAYMNALTRLLNDDLVPTPPYFIQDYAASVIQQALMFQVVDCDKVLVCRTVFQYRGEELSWRVIFFPTAKMRRIMEQQI